MAGRVIANQILYIMALLTKCAADGLQGKRLTLSRIQMALLTVKLRNRLMENRTQKQSIIGRMNIMTAKTGGSYRIAAMPDLKILIVVIMTMPTDIVCGLGQQIRKGGSMGIMTSPATTLFNQRLMLVWLGESGLFMTGKATFRRWFIEQEFIFGIVRLMAGTALTLGQRLMQTLADKPRQLFGKLSMTA